MPPITREEINKQKRQIKKLLCEDKINSIDNLELINGELVLSFTANNSSESISVPLELLPEKASVISNTVTTFDDLSSLTPEPFEFAYVTTSQGTQWLPGTLGGTYYGAGLYMWNGTEWIEDDTNIFKQLETLINNLNLEIQQRINADNLLQEEINIFAKDWGYYVQNWSTEPTLNTTIAEGDVYNYTLDGVTKYRLVPDPYDATQDAFYENFNGTTLSNLIITRG